MTTEVRKGVALSLPKGYKLTEVGVIPEDWEVKILRDLSTLITKGTTPKRFSDSGINYIKIECLDGDKINIEKCLYIDNNTNKTELKRSILNEGDLLFAIAGATIGKCTFVTKEIIPANTNQALSIIRLKDEESKMFVFYNLKSVAMQKYIADNIAGGAQPNLNLEQIGNFCFPLPPTKSEQTAIATALSEADALITSLEKLIEKKREIKQGTMQELLKPKEGWEVKKLGEECEIITKGTTPTSLGMVFQESGINFIKIESLTSKGDIIKEKVAYVDLFTHNLLKRSQLKVNDLLISIAGALGRIAIVNSEILPANTNQALAIARLKNESKLDRKFLFFILNTVKMQNHLYSISVQGAQPNLSLQNIYDLPIDFPAIQEQTHISTILSDMDAEITVLEQKLGKYKLIKQGMMQELLTGKIRLL